MWSCPYCDTEMLLATSRPGHLKNRQGCSQQHALHLAKEAEKQEELKKKRMAFFQPRALPRDGRESSAGPAKAPAERTWAKRGR